MILSIRPLGTLDLKSVWGWQEPGWPVCSCPSCLDHSSRILGHISPQMPFVRSPCPTSQSLSLSTHTLNHFTTASFLPLRAVGTSISLSYLVCPRMSRRARCIVGTRYIYLLNKMGALFVLGHKFLWTIGWFCKLYMILDTFFFRTFCALSPSSS